MNSSIGSRLRARRNELKLTVEKVSNELKIRPEFIKAIEEGNYSIFTSDIYAKGFIKNYSKFLGLNSDNFTAIYRRDIESTKLKTKDGKAIPLDQKNQKSFYFNRKSIRYLFFIITIIFVVFAVLDLLNKTFAPPYVELLSPTNIYADNKQTMDYYDKTVRITGKVNPNTAVKINGVIIGTTPDNTFESDLFPVTLEENKFLIEAISNVGVISRIELTLNKKTNIIEEAQGIYGIVQITKDSALVKIFSDGVEQTNENFFENDSVPVIAKSTVEIETDKPDNIKIFLNQQEYKIIDKPLKIVFQENKLVEE